MARPVEPAGGARLVGRYLCMIQIGGDDEDAGPVPCVIVKHEEQLVLAKLDGPRRIRALVKPDEDGFLVSGEIYCPWEDMEGCGSDLLNGRFEPAGNGGFKGSFDDGLVVVRLVPAPAGARGFGRDGYGDLDDGYGGASYGGASYGASGIRQLRRIDGRGRRHRH